jgi:predicted AAA+ superfamily ATPase
MGRRWEWGVKERIGDGKKIIESQKACISNRLNRFIAIYLYKRGKINGQCIGALSPAALIRPSG